MRRALIAIPTVSLGIGLLLLLWHSTVERPEREVPVPIRLPSPEDPDLRQIVRPSPPVPAPETGTLRLFVHVQGQGLAGARVALAREGDAEGVLLDTLGDGTRTAPDLPAGDYLAAVSHPEYLPARLPMRVEAGKAADLTVELREGGRIHGRVTDPAGNPIEGAEVRLIDGETRLPIATHPTATTDRTGCYDLAAVPPGEFGVLFRHVQRRPKERVGLSLRGANESHKVNVVLDEGTSVSGRVVDSSGAPIEGASVIAGNESAGVARTDLEGRFTIPGLGEAPVNCSASAPGYGTAYARGIAPGTRDLEIRLERGGTIQGRIEADPLPETFAVILTRYEEDLKRELPVQTRSFPRSPDGAFEVRDVAPGGYWVDIEAKGYAAQERPHVVIQEGHREAKVRIRLRLRE